MYKGEITGKGDNRYHAATRHARFEMASDGTASGPVDTLLASLCACLGHHLSDHLKTERIPFGEFSIAAECELAADRARIGDIGVVIKVDRAMLDEGAKASLVASVRQCCIHNTLAANSRITIQVVP